jgi:hypothetical protein
MVITAARIGQAGTPASVKGHLVPGPRLAHSVNALSCYPLRDITSGNGACKGTSRHEELRTIRKSWLDLSGHYDSASLQERSQLLERMADLADAELAGDHQERQEDRRELREDRRETREDRRERR